MPRVARDMAERQSPDGNKRPRGTPTVRPKVPLHEVAHQGEQLQSQKPDGHAHTKNAITLRACTTSSAHCRRASHSGAFTQGRVSVNRFGVSGRMMNIIKSRMSN